MRNVGSGRSAATVVLVGVSVDDMGRIRETLAAEAVLPSQSISFGDALQAVRRTRPDVVIVGFSQGLEAPLALAQALTKETPGVTLVALAEQSNADQILSAMRVGYKEYVVLPDDAARLRQVVHEAAYAPSDGDEEKGMVVSFVGSKGGVGTTVIAANVATELAAIHRAICLDLDFGMGDLASLLDLNPKDSITDLMPRADRLDERMLTGSAALHRSKLHVLAQPGELDASFHLDTDAIYGIINSAANAYQYVLIDCGTYMDDATTMACNVSDLVVLVCTPTVISVRDMYRRVRLLNKIGVDKDRLRLVVNRAHRGAYVSVADIEQNLGMKVIGSIPEDPRTVDEALNEGKLIREVNRRSEVARAISTLVAQLTEEGEGEGGPGDADPDSSRGFFFGLFNRG